MVNAIKGPGAIFARVLACSIIDIVESSQSQQVSFLLLKQCLTSLYVMPVISWPVLFAQVQIAT